MNCLKKFAYSAVAIAMIAGFSVSAQAKEWKGWNIHVAGYPNTVAMDKFAELLKEKSGGKMTPENVSFRYSWQSAGRH